MERKVELDSLRTAVKQILRKMEAMKYPLLVMLIGVILLLLPGREQKPPNVDLTAASPETESFLDLETRLEALLCEIEGAGRVQVLLTMQTGAETVYQEDLERRTQEEEIEVRSETVLTSDNGKDVPIAVKTIYPVYKGAVVACQGADSAAVRLNIVRAVASLTGLGSDKITVVKMKG